MPTDVCVAPSILAADMLHLKDQIDQIKTADYVHFDVMDGVFVPNLSFGPDLLRQVKAATDLPIDAHLMICDPDRRFEAYVAAGADMVTFHYEAQNHAHRTVGAIHDAGAKAGIAINPGTPVSVLESIIDEVDLVLVMSVNPGFGGQAFIESSKRKISAVREMAKDHGVEPLIEVDGGIGAANAGDVVAAGANVLVAGSSVFKAADPADAIAKIRAAACGRAGE